MYISNIPMTRFAPSRSVQWILLPIQLALLLIASVRRVGAISSGSSWFPVLLVLYSTTYSTSTTATELRLSTLIQSRQTPEGPTAPESPPEHPISSRILYHKARSTSTTTTTTTNPTNQQSKQSMTQVLPSYIVELGSLEQARWRQDEVYPLCPPT